MPQGCGYAASHMADFADVVKLKSLDEKNILYYLGVPHITTRVLLEGGKRFKVKEDSLSKI